MTFRPTLLRQCMAAVLLCAVTAQAQAASLIRDAEIEATLQRLSAPIFRAAGLVPSSVDIFMIGDRSLNAFVAGGRNIFVHTGLIIELDTPAELLGVMAHETGHITGGHLARRAINMRNARGPAMIGALLGLAAGVAGGGEAGAAIMLGTQSAVQRALLSFNRSEEAAADQAGILYLRRAGVDPNGLVKVIERFRGQEVLSIGNLDPYVQTHPLGTERMSLLERRVADIPAADWTTSKDDLYWYARMQAKLRGYLHSPERVLERLERRDETEMTLYERAYAYYRVPDTPAALADLDRLIRMRPNDPYYHETRGQFLLEARRPEEALKSYRTAVRLAPNATLLQAGLGRTLLQFNTPEANAEALRVLRSVRDADPADALALRDLAVAYERAGETGMATLATAERYALVGNVNSALSLANRASASLPRGSPGWLRAQDILKIDPTRN